MTSRQPGPSRAAAADRPRRRRDDPRGPPGRPFSMVALTAEDLTGRGRSGQEADGSWGPGTTPRRWKASAPTPARGTEPVFVGRTTTCRSPSPARRAAPPRRARHPPSRAGLRARQRRAAVRTEHQRGADQPAAGAGRHLPLPSAVTVPGSHPTSSDAHNGAPTSRCGAGTRCTTTESAPPSCTTPRAATTTPRRIRRASSGRSTSTTPARWAGATSPTTRWSTSTARSSRAARAAWTSRSRARTPAASTATPGAWR